MEYEEMSPEAQSYFDHLEDQKAAIGIVALVELPNEEMYFINVQKLTENETQTEYRDLIEDAVLNEEEYNSKITLEGKIAISSGGQHAMQSALEKLPCTVTHYLLAEVD